MLVINIMLDLEETTKMVSDKRNIHIYIFFLFLYKTHAVCPELLLMSTQFFMGKKMSVKNSFPVSILYKSIAGRYRPVRVADRPITARCRFVKNASWVIGSCVINKQHTLMWPCTCTDWSWSMLDSCIIRLISLAGLKKKHQHEKMYFMPAHSWLK